MKVALSILFTLSLVWAGSFPALSQTPTPTRSADLDGNGRIDFDDLNLILQSWQLASTPTPSETATDSEPPSSTETPTTTFTPSDTATPTDTPTSLQLVTIPSGSFLMGNSGSARDVQYGSMDEVPRHTVTINYSFQMGKYEVTNAQYAEVLNWAKERGYLRNSSNQPYDGGDVYHNGQFLLDADWEDCDISYNGSQFVSTTRNNESMANHPAQSMTWYGAVAFCNWLSEKEGRSPAYDLSTWSLTNRQGGGYRLPSESEWEYVCRGSSSNPNRYEPFSFGDDTNLDLFSFNFSSILDDYMVWRGNDDGWSEAVGSKLPNDYLLHDMHGNVSEWCQDWRHVPYDETGRPDDGRAWESPASSERMLRGGIWDFHARICRSAFRDSLEPGFRDYFLGFRVVRVP